MTDTILIRGGVLPDDAALEYLWTGATWGEGPLWMPAERVIRFSDIPGDRIMQFDPASGQTSVHRDAVEFTNGRTLDLDGSVIQCSHGRRAVEREAAGEVTTIVDSFGDARLNSPNDVVVASDGTIWFTDPAYGIEQPREGHAGEREYGECFVFRFDPRSGKLDPVIIDMEAPNGIAFSPDESVLYVSDTSGSNEDGRGNRSLRAYDVVDGRCKNGRVVTRAELGVIDGFRVDESGRIWTSSQDAIVVVDPAGTPVARIPVPETIANLCFGGVDGHDLYITASTSLYRIRTTTRDATWGGTIPIEPENRR